MRSFFQPIVRRAFYLCLPIALMIFCLPQLAASQSAPAGTVIKSVAPSTYFNNSLGVVEALLSNEVAAQVAAVPNLEVLGRSELFLTRGAMAQYYFEVLNSGNVPLETQMTVEDQAEDTMVNATRLVIDANRNGRIDPSEQAVTAASVTMLQPNERIQLIYEFRLSFAAEPDAELSSMLQVTGKPVGEYASETLIVNNAAGTSTVASSALELEKEQTVQEEAAATTLIYALRLRNNSEMDVQPYQEIDGKPIHIDGASRTGILLRDAIPLNTNFHSFPDEGGMIPLYHEAGAPLHDYRTTRPDGEIDAVAFFVDGPFTMGRSGDPSFAVSLAADLGDVEVINTAETFMTVKGQVIPLFSNTTRYNRKGAASGSLRFEDPGTNADQRFASLGRDTRLRLTSGACNASQEIDETVVTVRSKLTGDIEVFAAIETGKNTGEFVTPAIPLVRMDVPVSGDNVVATKDGGTIIATSDCARVTLNDELLINPGNFLFNSLTNVPVAETTIAMIDVASGQEVARRTTDARGFFAFGNVDTGEYKYTVINAPAWEFPSVRTGFPGFGRRVNTAGFGESFQHPGGVMNQSDIPVDPHYGAPVSLEKTSDFKRVTTGEFVTYTLKLTNNMQQALVNAEVLDTPPFGSSLVPGSVSLDGEIWADPVVSDNGDLVFDLDDITLLSAHEVTYVMQFTAAAREGPNENTAVLTGNQAGTGVPRQSPHALATVRLDNTGGVFARNGTVIGTVFMDCDGNGIPGDHREPGIPGVRIVTQSGLSVVTDINGKYSLFGLRPVTHAFQVQDDTLPDATQVMVTRTNDLMHGGSRLVPLRKGELRTENFAVRACTSSSLGEVADRREHYKKTRRPNSLVAADLPIIEQNSPVRSARNESGIATTTQLRSGSFSTEQEQRRSDPSPASDVDQAPILESLEDLIKSFDATPGFVDLVDGQTVQKHIQSVRVKAKADLSLELMVNGRVLGTDRIGERTKWQKTGVQALDFVAVKLAAGENRLTLIGRDSFGIERSRSEIRVVAPGKPAKMEIIAAPTASATPTDVIPVVVRVLDARNRPVSASGIVTLHAKLALWDVTDIRSGTPGVQVYLDNGEATFDLIPPQVAGNDIISVSGSFGRAEASITFTPDLDQRVMVGVIEGAIALGGEKSQLLDPGRFSSFEDTITGLRGEVYLKGAISGKTLLTLRYRSDQDTEARLFRDIQGDEYYPVYGDNSERGYDAQSSGNLYVKVEKGRSYILYGDIAIESEASALKLDGIRRVAQGAKAHWENDKVSITLFGARTALEQRVQEISGRGVSGPYSLVLDGYVQGTERVEILVRDKEGGDVITSSPLRRGTDYLLDFFRNSLTFDDPVRQFDARGNPVSIRITYEVDVEGADRYWLYGGEINVAVGERTTIGARAVHADAVVGNTARERLQSSYIRHEDRNGGIWEAEFARSENNQRVPDTAVRFSYGIRNEFGHLDFEVIHAGPEFVSRGGLALPGTTRSRLDYSYQIDNRTDFLLGVEYIRDQVSDNEQLLVDAVYAKQFNKHFRGFVGLEYRLNQDAGDTDSQTGVIIGAHWSPVSRPGTVIKAELRQPLAGDDRPTKLTLGMSREPIPGWRSYSDIEMTFGDDQISTYSRLGFSYDLNDWLRGNTDFVKSIADLDTVMNQALMATWAANTNTTFTFGVEHSRRMEANDQELTSVAVGAKWGSGAESWVGDADFDSTFEKNGKTHYASIGLAGKISTDFTFLGRSRVALDKRNGGYHRRIRSRVGVAYRPIEDPRLEMLAWYEHRIEEKFSKSVTHLWSVDASFEVNQDLRLNGKYAGQSQRIEFLGGHRAQSMTQLLQAGFNCELADDRFQIGLSASHLWDDAGNSTNGLGVEIGFVPTKGALLALGYNKAKGETVGRNDLYQQGLYLRINFLLDDSLWDQLDQFLGI